MSMSALRELLSVAGFEHVGTYLQSGNVVLSSDATADLLTIECERLIAAHFGLDIRVVVRTGGQLAQIVKRHPLGQGHVDPKRYQVSFLAGPLAPEMIRKLAAAAAPPERVAVVGREIYTWHAAGIAGSDLWKLIGGRGLGVASTTRNWNTCVKLLAMAGDHRP
jgi:uncharacterized protein (DUF1697 family)